MRARARLCAVAAFAVLAACARGSAPLPAAFGPASRSAAPHASSASPQFIGFWESWSDTNPKMAYYRLSSVPRSVTTVDIAFSIANGNTIAPAQNTHPLAPGVRAIHRRGGKVLLSFGGATSRFGITNVRAFVKNLQAFVAANPGLYDGFDFDDEVIQDHPSTGRQQLIAVLDAVRAAFPTAIISFDADSSGADPNVDVSNYSGEDRLVLRKAGNAISYVNVMDYDQFGWKPTGHPGCSYAAGAADDCYLDVMKEFANVPMPGGSRFPAGKIVMGLMIGKADDHTVITPQDAAWYARWVVSNAYHGIMIWDVDLDNPQAPMQGTGHPKGTYVRAISGALGT